MSSSATGSTHPGDICGPLPSEGLGGERGVRPAGVRRVDVRSGRDDLVDAVQQRVVERDVGGAELRLELLDRARAAADVGPRAWRSNGGLARGRPAAGADERGVWQHRRPMHALVRTVLLAVTALLLAATAAHAQSDPDAYEECETAGDAMFVEVSRATCDDARRRRGRDRRRAGRRPADRDRADRLDAAARARAGTPARHTTSTPRAAPRRCESAAAATRPTSTVGWRAASSLLERDARPRRDAAARLDALHVVVSDPPRHAPRRAQRRALRGNGGAASRAVATPRCGARRSRGSSSAACGATSRAASGRSTRSCCRSRRDRTGPPRTSSSA